jgi:MFS family permease
VLALLIKLFVKEPPRGWSERQSVEAAPQAQAAADPPPSLATVAKRLFGTWSMVNMILGFLIASFATYGIMQYIAPYMMRALALDLTTVGLLTGVLGGISSGTGMLIGGAVADRAGARSGRWYGLAPALTTVAMGPLYIAAFMQHSWAPTAAILCVPFVLSGVMVPTTYAVTHSMVDARMRATAVALVLLSTSLVAMGFGPPFAGWAIDQFARLAFTAKGLAGDFISACPGGIAPGGAPAALTAACPSAMAEGTRHGLMTSALFFFWGAAHFALAAVTLPRDLARAKAVAAAPGVG